MATSTVGPVNFAPTTTFSGLASGINSAGIISAMVGVAKQPVTAMQNNQADLQSKSTKFSTLSTELAALGTAAQALGDISSASPTIGSTSDSTVATITAGNGASTGSYQIAVTQLAQAQRTYTDGFASQTTTGLLTSGTLTLSVNGTTTPITIDGTTDSLASVVSKINGSGAAVKAALFYDGTSWRMSVTGTQTGAANAVTFDETGGTNLGFNTDGNTVQSAKDASFTVDGFSMSSATNTVSTAIPNVTIALKGVSAKDATTGKPVPLTATVAPDEATMAGKLGAFVSAYNTIVSGINGEFAWTGSAKAGDTLSGDFTLRQVQNGLAHAITTAVGNNTGYETLSSIGIGVQQDGTLKFDSTKFSTKFQAAPDKVAQLFAQTNADHTQTGVMDVLNNLVNSYTDPATGSITNRIKSIATQVNTINSQIDAANARIAIYQKTLQAEYTNLEKVMSQLQAQSNSLASNTNTNSVNNKTTSK